MANHFRLFGRPLSADEVELGLSVTGVLDEYTAGEAYESRLSINNSIGRCSVQVLESTLPPGAAVRVDNITKEVVVKWAAFIEVEEEETLVPNGDFELGDDGSWVPGGGSNGEGWSIGTGTGYDANEGTYSARFANIKTKGSDLLNTLIPAKVNDYIRCTAEINQGASSSGNAGARVSLVYRNSAGAELQRNSGNLVTSGRGGAWHQSLAEGGAPEDTANVQVILSAYRNKENKPLWVDTVKWNHKYVLGQDSDELYMLTIRVTDSLNRTALWSGTVDEAGQFFTSQLYPFSVEGGSISSNSYALSGSETVFRTSDALGGEATSTVAVLGGDLRVLNQQWSVGNNYVTHSSSVLDGTIRTLLLSTTAQESPVTHSASVRSGTIGVYLVSTSNTESINSSPTVVSGTLS